MDEWRLEVKRILRTAEQEEDASEQIRMYEAALARFPESAASSSLATEVLCALGEQYFRRDDHVNALHCYSRAVATEGGLGLASIHLRLGQIRFEMGEMDRARDELMRAYLGSGHLIFENQDPKYYALIEEIAEKQ